jgi:arsenate reductase
MAKTKVIFLCKHNSARCQMAEAFLTKNAGDRFEVYSAGYKPQAINPVTIKVMQEIGYDLSKQESKKLRSLSRSKHFGIIKTVCKRSKEEDCPTILGTGTGLFWGIPDPTAFEGSEEEKLAKFRQIRDQINEHVKGFLIDRGIAVKSK